MSLIKTTLYTSTAGLLIVLSTMKLEYPIIWVPLMIINLLSLILTIRENFKKGKSEVSLKFIIAVMVIIILALSSVVLR